MVEMCWLWHTANTFSTITCRLCLLSGSLLSWREKIREEKWRSNHQHNFILPLWKSRSGQERHREKDNSKMSIINSLAPSSANISVIPVMDLTHSARLGFIGFTNAALLVPSFMHRIAPYLVHHIIPKVLDKFTVMHMKEALCLDKANSFHWLSIPVVRFLLGLLLLNCNIEAWWRNAWC